MRERHATIDIAKGIGIVLVVLGHDPTVGGWGWPGWMIFSFHMPLFFVLSGLFLMPSRDLGRFADARFHSILKPYFVVALLIASAKLVAAGSGIVGPVDAAQLFGGLLYGTGSSLMWTPMWYLPHLFIASCASLVLLKVLGGRPELLLPVCAAMLALGVLAIGRVPELPWSADLLAITVPFMLAGWHLREWLVAPGFRWLPSAIVVAVFVTLNLAFDARMDLNARVYDHVLISTAEAACGIYLVLAVSKGVQHARLLSRVFSYLGSASLFILIFHHPVHLKALSVLHARGVPELPASALAVTAGLLLPLLVWEAAQRLPPMRWLLLPRPRVAATPA